MTKKTNEGARFATNESGVIKEQPNGKKITGNDLRARGGKK